MIVESIPMETVEQLRTELFRNMITQKSIQEIIILCTRELSKITDSDYPKIPNQLMYPVNMSDFSAMVGVIEARYIIMRLAAKDAICHRVISNGYETYYVLNVPNRSGNAYVIYRNQYTDYLSLSIMRANEIKGYSMAQSIPMRKICDSMGIEIPEHLM